MVATFLTATVWFPVDVTAGIDTQMSAWPRLSASILHDLGVTVRDFVPAESRIEFRACETSNTTNND